MSCDQELMLLVNTAKGWITEIFHMKGAGQKITSTILLFSQDPWHIRWEVIFLLGMIHLNV